MMMFRSAIDLVGWFIFYYGAWNVMDMLGLLENMIFNTMMMLVGFVMLLIIARHDAKNEKKQTFGADKNVSRAKDQED